MDNRISQLSRDPNRDLEELKNLRARAGLPALPIQIKSSSMQGNCPRCRDEDLSEAIPCDSCKVLQHRECLGEGCASLNCTPVTDEDAELSQTIPWIDAQDGEGPQRVRSVERAGSYLIVATEERQFILFDVDTAREEYRQRLDDTWSSSDEVNDDTLAEWAREILVNGAGDLESYLSDHLDFLAENAELEYFTPGLGDPGEDVELSEAFAAEHGTWDAVDIWSH